MRVDLHLHIGKVYESDKAVEVPIDTNDLKSYIYDSELTHVCAVYIDRQQIEDLMSQCPDVKIYPIQWVDTTSSTINFDINKGIKLHTFRGQKNILDKTIVSDYTSDQCKNMLQRLPQNYLIQYHLQSSTSIYNTARAQVIMMLAIKFPYLKHMLIHGGAFGLNTMYPTNKESKYWDAFTHLAVSAELLVREAQLVADKLSNVFMDSSILFNSNTFFKTKYVCECLKSGFGSDYPFCKNKQGKVILGIKNQEQVVERLYGKSKVEEMHRRSLEWLESDMVAVRNILQNSKN